MATKKIDKMYQLYQENVSQGMAQDLADHLAVSYESVLELGAGYCPVAQFKNGPSQIGWWAFPERDSKGTLTGLSLRHCKEDHNDVKAMFLPSNRNLIYAVNPAHSLGQPVYKPGKHNWVRTMDAGIECPVCYKPDGCLISADDPENPSAAICIRVSEGSVKEVKGGGSYLHHLNGRGAIDRFAPILPPSDNPVVVVEGATDTLAGMSLGLVTVGKPNAKGGLQELAELLRGRSVIIMGENDKKEDGSCPGREGMLLTAQVLQRVCKDVLKVMPPSEYKDLRRWRAGTGLTAEDFLAYCAERGDRTIATTILPDSRPRTAGIQYLKDEYLLGDRYVVRQQVDTLYKWTGHRYQEVTPKEVFGPMYAWAHSRQHIVETPKGEKIVPIRADRAWMLNAVDAVIDDIRIDRKVKFPAWINGVSGPPAHEIIPFQNGLLHLPSFLEGRGIEEYLLPTTPDYFNRVCLPYEFDETATCPVLKKFTGHALGPPEIKLLRQWIGYCLVWDNQFQKFMLLRGVKLSGKSTILNLIADLVGDDHYDGPSFQAITGKYAMGDLVGKLVLGIDEADITKNSDVDAIAAIIKNLTGDSPQKTEQKYKKATGASELCARITMTANETPYLPDNADAVARRMMIIEFNNPAKVEDTKLRQKLRNELPGIALWALQGLREIYEKDEDGNFKGFSEPESMLQAKQEWREHANPMGTFYNQCCDHSPGKYTAMFEIRDAFNAFNGERGGSTWGLARIQERFRLVASPGVVPDKIQSANGRPLTVMKNVTLKNWAVEQYLQGD